VYNGVSNLRASLVVRVLLLVRVPLKHLARSRLGSFANGAATAQDPPARRRQGPRSPNAHAMGVWNLRRPEASVPAEVGERWDTHPMEQRSDPATVSLLGWLAAQQDRASTTSRLLPASASGPRREGPGTKQRGESLVDLSGPRREGPETRNRGESPAPIFASGSRREGPQTLVRGESE
jgi:hypothetical protein